MEKAGYPTERQIDAIAYELAERFFQRAGGVKTAQQVDDLAAAIAAAIREWFTGERPL